MKALPIIATVAETAISLLILLCGFIYTRADTDTGGGLDLTNALLLQVLVLLLVVVIFRIWRPGKWTLAIFAGTSVVLLTICTINWFDVPYVEIGSYRRDEDIWTLAIPSCLILVALSFLMWRGRGSTKGPRRISADSPPLLSLSELRATIPPRQQTSEQDATSNGGQRSSLNSGFPSRRG